MQPPSSISPISRILTSTTGRQGRRSAPRKGGMSSLSTLQHTTVVLTSSLGPSKRRTVQDVHQHTVRKVAKILKGLPLGEEVRSDKATKGRCDGRANCNGMRVEWEPAMELTKRKLANGGVGKGDEWEWAVYIVPMSAPLPVAGHSTNGFVVGGLMGGMADGGVSGEGQGAGDFSEFQGG